MQRLQSLLPAEPALHLPAKAAGPPAATRGPPPGPHEDDKVIAEPCLMPHSAIMTYNNMAIALQCRSRGGKLRTQPETRTLPEEWVISGKVSQSETLIDMKEAQHHLFFRKLPLEQFHRELFEVLPAWLWDEATSPIL